MCLTAGLVYEAFTLFFLSISNRLGLVGVDNVHSAIPFSSAFFVWCLFYLSSDLWVTNGFNEWVVSKRFFFI